MSRDNIYLLKDNKQSTFDFDEKLPPLPLPSLTHTLVRYYDSLEPFATPEELDKTRKILGEFSDGIGLHLQKKLKYRAANMKNWLEDLYEKYAYNRLRIPLYPYMCMCLSMKLDHLGIKETHEYRLKTMARIIYHKLEFWNLLRSERIKPISSNGGRTIHSSAMLRNFFSTSRIPGETTDKIVTHFKSVIDAGQSPTHGLIIGKGRIFIFDCLNEDGSILSAQQILAILSQISDNLELEGQGDCIPVLTNDDRTSWAKNRQRLLEISQKNQNHLVKVESSVVVGILDDNEPKNYEKVAEMGITGDFHSKWADRSTLIVSFRNGRFALLGEHSAYDGTISVQFNNFVQLSLKEAEPDWDVKLRSHPVPIEEIRFDLDNKLRSEVQRVMADCDTRRDEVMVTDFTFDGFGKDFLKNVKLYPDSFIQVMIQWTYYLLHQEFAPVYETALMRHYYNGRTETLRSCSMAVVNFIKAAADPSSSTNSIAESLRKAVNHHTLMMKYARDGKAVDRHLFGLWCLLQEEGLETPALYTDPLYKRSGGGSNFVLSTSTLGFTGSYGFAAPMVLDGYGFFYSIDSDAVYMNTTVFRKSQKTNARKFNEKLAEVMLLARKLLRGSSLAKL